MKFEWYVVNNSTAGDKLILEGQNRKLQTSWDSTSRPTYKTLNRKNDSGLFATAGFENNKHDENM